MNGNGNNGDQAEAFRDEGLGRIRSHGASRDRCNSFSIGEFQRTHIRVAAAYG